MGRRYVPEDMIRASDFKEMFARMSETKKARAGAAVDHGVELMLSDHPIGMRMPFDFSRKSAMISMQRVAFSVNPTVACAFLFVFMTHVTAEPAEGHALFLCLGTEEAPWNTRKMPFLKKSRSAS